MTCWTTVGGGNLLVEVAGIGEEGGFTESRAERGANYAEEQHPFGVGECNEEESGSRQQNACGHSDAAKD